MLEITLYLYIRVKYTDSPCGFPKFLDLVPLVLQFVTHLVPNFFQKYMDGPCGLHFVTHLVPNLEPTENFIFVGWGLRALQSANHRDHPCTFKKLGTKSKI
ncbi:hypothetical protein Hanom_Chr02g00176971 [Helianthus anomalus]